MFSTPRIFQTPRTPSRDPGPAFSTQPNRHNFLPTALHKFLVRKMTFVTLFGTYELLSYELVSFRKSKIQHFCCVVSSMKEIYEKVILISFSVKPVLRFQIFCFGFWQTLSRQITQPLPSARNFATWHSHNMQIRKTEGSQMAVIRCHLPAISASKQFE